MGAIIRNYSGKLLEVGGMPDHVHLLVELSNLDKFSHFVRDLKASGVENRIQVHIKKYGPDCDFLSGELSHVP